MLLVSAALEERALGQSYLRFAGFHVEVASNAGELMDWLGRSRPAVVVLDATLPGGDVWLLARHLKTKPNIEGVRVIMMSEEPVPRHEGTCDAVVPKPCPPEQLVACVLRELSSVRRIALGK